MKAYKPEDEKVLCEFYERMNADHDCNVSRVVWELLRNAPYFDMFQTDKIGLWYEDNELVTAVRLLSPWPGIVAFDNRSNNDDLLLEAIQYAEDVFSGFKDEKKFLVTFVSETQGELRRTLLSQGYEQLPNEGGILQYALNKSIPIYSLPEGLEVKKLSEVYDFDKLSKLIWEGFNYEGKVPRFNDDVYPTIKHAWLKYNRDICSVVMAPDSMYASFCGFWYDDITKTGFLEPMVTAKEFRKQGLGKACIYHSLRILQSYGCKKVFVEPDEEPYNFYCSLGFEKVSYGYYFKKVLG